MSNDSERTAVDWFNAKTAHEFTNKQFLNYCKKCCKDGFHCDKIIEYDIEKYLLHMNPFIAILIFKIGRNYFSTLIEDSELAKLKKKIRKQKLSKLLSK